MYEKKLTFPDVLLEIKINSLKKRNKVIKIKIIIIFLTDKILQKVKMYEKPNTYSIHTRSSVVQLIIFLFCMTLMYFGES